MKKSYESGLATHIGPESCGAAREGGIEALTGEPAAEVMEGSALTKGNLTRAKLSPDTKPGKGAKCAGTGTSSCSQREKAQVHEPSCHHIASVDTLRAAYFCFKQDAARGVDGMTWLRYGEALEAYLADFADLG